jgi:aconitate hydratase
MQVEKGIAPKAILGINPGSEQVRYTAERDGLIDTFNKLEGTRIFTNACGPCIGQWAREGAEKQEKNSIVHSFNRNFRESVLTVTRTHTPSLLHQKWLQLSQSLVN